MCPVAEVFRNLGYTGGCVSTDGDNRVSVHQMCPVDGDYREEGDTDCFINWIYW